MHVVLGTGEVRERTPPLAFDPGSTLPPLLRQPCLPDVGRLDDMVVDADDSGQCHVVQGTDLTQASGKKGSPSSRSRRNRQAIQLSLAAVRARSRPTDRRLAFVGLPYHGRVPPASDNRPERRWRATRRRRISLEEIEDAVVDGDSPVPARSGTARAALSPPHLPHRLPRAPSPRTSAPGCRTSSWAPTPTTSRTRPRSSASSSSPSSGPTLVLPMVGGLLADKIDRKRFLIVLSIEQLVFSLGVALVAASPHPSHVLLVIMVLGVGAGSAMFGPAYSAVLPGLVGKAGPAGRHLAELGPDERLPGHRPGHRRPPVLAGRAGLDLRRQRRHLPLRGRRR